MRNLKKLLVAYEAGCHPGASVVEAVIRQSNSPEFIVALARDILRSAHEDLAEDRKIRNAAISLALKGCTE